MRTHTASEFHTPLMELEQSHLESPALDHRVRRDVPELTPVSQQHVRAQQEARSQIGAALYAAAIPRLQRDQVVTTECAGNLLPAKERRIADNRIKSSRAGVHEEFGEREWPVQGTAGFLARRQARVDVVNERPQNAFVATDVVRPNG